MSQESYIRGFVKTAEEHGVDPVQLAKYAAKNYEYEKYVEDKMREAATRAGMSKKEFKKLRKEVKKDWKALQKDKKVQAQREEIERIRQKNYEKRMQGKGDALRSLISGTSTVGSSTSGSGASSTPAKK